MDLFEPLSQAECKELRTFLSRKDAPAGAVRELPALDGFLTCVVIGPDALMPSHWLPVLFGGVLPEFEDARRMERMLGMILRHMNWIVLRFQESPPLFVPLLSRRRAGKRDPVIGSWCVGFMRAADLCRAKWMTLLNRGDPGSLLYPIWLHASEEGGEHLRVAPGTELSSAPAEPGADALERSVLALHAHWLERRVDARPEAAGFKK